MRSILVVLTLIILSACSSAPKKSEKSEDSPSNATEVNELNIDYEMLMSSLGLDRDIRQLGYAEKSFNTCAVGFGYSSNKNCRLKYFAVINFQLLCRESQGTISTPLGREDMRALSGRTVNWTLMNLRGSSRLDNDGHGKIAMVFRNSPKHQRLKLNVDHDNLYLRSGEIKRVVTPSNWCNQ